MSVHRYKGPIRYEPLTEDLVNDCLRQGAHETTGYSSVPKAVRCVLERSGLSSAREAVKEIIYDLASVRIIELSPDSGFGDFALTPEERLLCPDGPQGTKLSSARFL